MSLLRMSALVLTFSVSLAHTAGAAVTQSCNPNWGTLSIGQIELQVTATGGSGTYSWSVVAGSLPPGISPRTDKPGWFPPSVSAGLSGVATTPGTYPFTLRAADASNLSDFGDCVSTIKISPLTLKDSFQLPDGFVGSPYVYTLTALGNTGTVTWAITGGSLAGSGLTLNASTGQISGTPTTATTYPLQVSLQDSATTDTYVRGINIRINPVNITTDGVLPNAVQGTSYGPVTVVASGGSGTGYTFTAGGGMPPGLSMNPAGVISGSISSTAFASVYGFSVTVKDSLNNTYTKNMSIDLVSVPWKLPYIRVYGYLEDCTIGVACNRSFGVLNGGTAPFVWSASGLPAGMSIRSGLGLGNSFTMAGDAEIWGTPTQTGTFNVQVTVTDAIGKTATNTFPLYVSRLLQTDYPPNGTLNAPYNGGAPVKLRVIGGTPPYNLTILAGHLPAGLTLDSNTQLLSGTPVEDGVNPSFNFNFKVTDSAGSPETLRNTDYFQVFGPKTLDINTSYFLGTPTINTNFSFQLFSCCAASVNWTLQSGSLPNGITLSASGLVSGVPTVAGPFTFTAKATDNADATNFAQRQFLIIVSPLQLTSGTFLPDGNVGSAYNAPLVVTGATGAVTWTLDSGTFLPPGISIGAGALTGTPTASGQFSFSMTATDSIGKVISRGFTVTIFPAGTTGPVNLFLGGIAGNVNFNASSLGFNSYALSASGGTGPYHYSITSGAVPGFRTIDGPPQPNTFNFPTAEYLGVGTTPGVYNTVIRVTDSVGGFLERTATITVLNTQVTSQPTIPRAAVGVPYSPFTLTMIPASQVLTFNNGLPIQVNGWGLISGSLPAGLSMSPSGVITGTPNGGTAGGYAPQVTRGSTRTWTDLNADSIPNCDFANFLANGECGAGTTNNPIRTTESINVDPFGITTSGLLPQGVFGTPYPTTTLTASNCGTGCTWTGFPSGLGLTLNSSTGQISGTPTSTTTALFTITATGSNGVAQKTFSLVIVGNTPQRLVIGTNATQGYNTIGNSVAVALTASGGQPPYSWSVTGGTLPPGVTIQGPGRSPGCQAFDIGTSTCTTQYPPLAADAALGQFLAPGWTYLAGRIMGLGTNGAYDFTLSVTDNAGATATKNIHWLVSALAIAPGYNNLGGSTLQNGLPIQQALLAAGGTGNYTWTNTTPMPAGLTLSSAGVVSGTPQYTGSFNTTVQVSDDAGNTLVFNLALGIPAPGGVTLGLGASQTVVRGANFSLNLAPSGGTPPYSITPTTPLPPGFAILAGSSNLSNGTPGTSYFLSGAALGAGPYSFTLQVQDSSNPVNTALRPFTFTVVPFTVQTPNGLPDASTGVAYSQQLNAWSNGGAVTWSLTPDFQLPAGLTLSSGGLISGTPTAGPNALGTYSLVLSATASGVTINPSFTLRVSNLNITDPAVLADSAPGNAYNHTFTATGGGGPLTWSAQILPPNLTLSPSGVLSGTLAGNIALGPQVLLLTVTDGGVPFTKRFGFTVRPYNAPSYVFSSAGVLPDTVVGANFSFQLNANGGTPPFTWSVAPGSNLPPGLHLISGAALPPGTNPVVTLLAGAPSATGTYVFDLIATDTLNAQVQRTFTLNVSPVEIVSGTARNGTVGVAYAQRLTAVGGTGPYTFTMTPSSSGGEMLPPGWSITSDGLIAGTPTETGVYNFVVQAHDGSGNNFSRSYSIVIANASGLFVQTTSPPDAWIGSGRASGNLNVGSIAGPLSTYTWSLVSGTLPPGMSLVDGATVGNPGTTLFGGQPMTPGTYTYKLRATDNANSGNFAEHTFTFRVAPMQFISPLLAYVDVGDLPGAHVGVPYSFLFRVTGGTGPYTFLESPLVPLPPGFTLSANGVLSGTPQSATIISVAPIVTDALGRTFAAPAMVLAVSPPNTPWPLFATSENDFPDASVGQAYDLPLSFFPLTRYGVKPLTWSVAPGSTLPPGLSIGLGAGSTTPDHLLGTPTVAGNYSFALVATDATGHSALVPASSAGVMKLSVTTLTAGPAGIFLPRGVVAAPYPSISLAASGGAAPYQYQVYLGSDLPPGLTVNPTTGLLSGTPTSPGSFVLIVTVMDNTLSFLNKIYLINVAKPPQELRNTDFDNDGRRDLGVYRPSTGQWFYLSSVTGSATPVLAGTLGSGTDRIVAGDFDGDGKGDVGVFHPTGQWEIKLSGGGTLTRSFGLNTDIPVPGDYDGDGKTDVAIYRPSEGKWYYLSSSTGSLTPISMTLGSSGDTPVPGDYDGDGITDAAVYHAATGQWSLLYSHNGLVDVITLGSRADRPVPRDYDGDGITDVAIFHPSGLWSIRRSSTGVTVDIPFGLGTDVPAPADLNGDGTAELVIYRTVENKFYVYVPSNPSNPMSFAIGQGGDLPLVGGLPFVLVSDEIRSRDDDGDHKADPMVYRPSTGAWSFRQSSNNYANVTARVFGSPTDTPVPGDYDGDGITDLAVYTRKGQWIVLLSSTNFTTTTGANWGLNTDIPVPGDYDGDGRTDFAVFRPSEGKWYVLSANLTTQLTFTLGAAGDIPVPGDFDGDRRADPAVYRRATGQWLILPSSTGSLVQATFGSVTDIPVTGDFDGDGKTDIGVYEQNGLWDIELSSTSFTTHQLISFGLGTDVPVPGDYDGDGKTDPAVFRPSTGEWFIEFSSTNYATSQTFTLGSGTDRVVPGPAGGSPVRTDVTRAGDYDGDGKRDVAVYTPAGGWVVKLSSTGYTTLATLPPFGLPTDHPVPGDYDGDGRTDLAIFRPSDTTWYIGLSGTGFATVLAKPWGTATDLRVPADYDGDGKTDIAVFRPSDGTWRILFSTGGFTANTTVTFGLNGDVPVPGDYDGDGKADLGVYRPSEGKWYILTAASGFTSGFSVVLGVPGDIPVPGDYDGDGKTDVAMYHTSGQWEAWLSGSNFTTSLVRPFGLSTDRPAQADYDGDGQVDFAIYRPAESTWYILLSTTNYASFISVANGTPSVDLPLPPTP